MYEGELGRDIDDGGTLLADSPLRAAVSAGPSAWVVEVVMVGMGLAVRGLERLGGMGGKVAPSFLDCFTNILQDARCSETCWAVRFPR